VTIAEVSGMLRKISEVVRSWRLYAVEGHEYIQIDAVVWKKHQDIRWVVKSKLPCYVDVNITTSEEFGSLQNFSEDCESLPHIPARASRARVVLGSLEKSKTNTNGAPVNRFSEWIEPWPRVGDPDSALRNYLSRVTPETESAAFACRDRYLSSDEVGRGVVIEPWKFIRTQADCGWTGKWPTKNVAKAGDQWQEMTWDKGV
jgi:hypothetical protein